LTGRRVVHWHERDTLAVCDSVAALIEQQRSELTVPFLGSSSAARSVVGETRFAHATVLRAVPTECPHLRGQRVRRATSACVD
jgi:hypothetical protein